MRVGSLLACAAVAPFLMSATEPLRLQPSSPWVVNYDVNSCRLARNFGTGRNETKLAFESEAPDQLEMVAIGWPLQTYQEEISARFLPVGGRAFTGHVNQTADRHQPAVLWANPPMASEVLLAHQEEEAKRMPKDPRVRPPAEDPARIAAEKADHARFTAAVSEVEFEPRHGREVVLETGSLGPAFAKFEECNEDSLRDWGVDPAVQARIVRPVWAVNPSEWLFASDYPPGMRARGAESVVEVRLIVDAAGRVTKCTPLSHFDEPEFNKVSCARITERAQFEPAELADGTKVPSYYTKRVIFRMAR